MLRSCGVFVEFLQSSKLQGFLPLKRLIQGYENPENRNSIGMRKKRVKVERCLRSEHALINEGTTSSKAIW